MLRVGPELTEVDKMRNMAYIIMPDGGMPSTESVATALGTVHVAGYTPFFPVLQRTCDNRYAQAKLEIGQIDDVYEQEADCVADVVMQMIEPDGIHLCDLFFNSPPDCPKDMITHECFHLAGLGDNSKKRELHTADDALNDADAMAQLVAHIATGRTDACAIWWLGV